MTAKLIDKFGQVWVTYSVDKVYREEDIYSEDNPNRHLEWREHLEGLKPLSYVLMSARINAPDSSVLMRVVTARLLTGEYVTIFVWEDCTDRFLAQETLRTTSSLYAERDFLEAARTARKSIRRDFSNA